MGNLRYLVLAGPTAVGKTDLAIRIAQTLKTEIVGADAFQIYQGLDLLTGKPTSAQLMAIRHHLVAALPLAELCDAHKYALLARQTITALNQRGITPLVVGGTGFYLQALEEGLPPLPAADLGLRTELDRLSTEDLLRELTIRDMAASNRIDRSNRRRIIRALEVCLLFGKPFSSFSEKTDPDPAIACIALEESRAVLITKIGQRVDAMFEQGVVAEVAAVETIGSTASRAIGFQLIRSLLAGNIDFSTCREAIKQQTRSYAKRQMTWFRRSRYQLLPADCSADLVIEAFQRQIQSLKAN